MISMATLKKVVQDLGDFIDESQLQQMIQKADNNGDGLVSEQEFYLYMTDKTRKTDD